jgi:hypothetical protein
MVKKMPGVVDVPKRSHIDPVLRKYIWVDSQKKKYIKKKNKFKQITKYKGKYIVKKQKAGGTGDGDDGDDGVGDDAGGFAAQEKNQADIDANKIRKLHDDIDDDAAGFGLLDDKKMGWGRTIPDDDADVDADDNLGSRLLESKKTGIKAPAYTTKPTPHEALSKKRYGKLVNNCNKDINKKVKFYKTKFVHEDTYYDAYFIYYNSKKGLDTLSTADTKKIMEGESIECKYIKEFKKDYTKPTKNNTTKTYHIFREYKNWTKKFNDYKVYKLTDTDFETYTNKYYKKTPILIINISNKDTNEKYIFYIRFDSIRFDLYEIESLTTKYNDNLSIVDTQNIVTLRKMLDEVGKKKLETAHAPAPAPAPAPPTAPAPTQHIQQLQLDKKRPNSALLPPASPQIEAQAQAAAQPQQTAEQKLKANEELKAKTDKIRKNKELKIKIKTTLNTCVISEGEIKDKQDLNTLNISDVKSYAKLLHSLIIDIRDYTTVLIELVNLEEHDYRTKITKAFEFLELAKASLDGNDLDDSSDLSEKYTLLQIAKEQVQSAFNVTEVTEEQKLLKLIADNNKRGVDVAGDGACQFNAIAEQIKTRFRNCYINADTYTGPMVRGHITKWMDEKGKTYSFNGDKLQNFLSLEGDEVDWDTFATRMKIATTYGGPITLKIALIVYARHIHIYGSTENIKKDALIGTVDPYPIMLGHLSESHYWSVHEKDDDNDDAVCDKLLIIGDSDNEARDATVDEVENYLIKVFNSLIKMSNDVNRERVQSLQKLRTVKDTNEPNRALQEALIGKFNNIEKNIKIFRSISPNIKTIPGLNQFKTTISIIDITLPSSDELTGSKFSEEMLKKYTDLIKELTKKKNDVIILIDKLIALKNDVAAATTAPSGGGYRQHARNKKAVMNNFIKNLLSIVTAKNKKKSIKHKATKAHPVPDKAQSKPKAPSTHRDKQKPRVSTSAKPTKEPSKAAKAAKPSKVLAKPSKAPSKVPAKPAKLPAKPTPAATKAVRGKTVGKTKKAK